MKNKFIININIFRNVQTRNLQVIQSASFQQNVGTDEKNKGIFKKLFQIIGVIISFVAALLTILHYLGLLHR